MSLLKCDPTVSQVEHLFKNILEVYKKLRALGFTYYNGFDTIDGMAGVGERDKPEIQAIDTKLFVPLSTTEEGLPIVSPHSILKQNRIYDDQVLVCLPFLAESNVQEIGLLFERRIIPRGPIVDIGCGAGVLVKKLKEKGYSAYGIEILGSYGQSWKDRNIDSYCYIGNLEDISGVQDESFVLVVTRAFWDSAFGTDGQGGINDARRCLEEINRILKPEGVFFFLSDNNRHFEKLVKYAKQLGLTELRVDGIDDVHSGMLIKPRH